MTRVIRSFALHGEVCCLFRWSYLRFRRHRMKIVAQATEDTTARTPISLVPGVILKGVKVFPLTWSFFASYIKTNNAERSQVAFMILFPPFWSQSASLLTVILWRAAACLASNDHTAHLAFAVAIALQNLGLQHRAGWSRRIKYSKHWETHRAQKQARIGNSPKGTRAKKTRACQCPSWDQNPVEKSRRTAQKVQHHLVLLNRQC